MRSSRQRTSSGMLPRAVNAPCSARRRIEKPRCPTAEVAHGEANDTIRLCWQGSRSARADRELHLGRATDKKTSARVVAWAAACRWTKSLDLNLKHTCALVLSRRPEVRQAWATIDQHSCHPRPPASENSTRLLVSHHDPRLQLGTSSIPFPGLTV